MYSTALLPTPHIFDPPSALAPSSRSRLNAQLPALVGQLSKPGHQHHQNQHKPAREAAPLPSSYRATPAPSINMGTTYQPPNLASYENGHHPTIPGYGSALAQADRKRTALSEAQAALNGYSRPPPASQSQPPQIQTTHHSNRHGLAPSMASQPTSRHSTRPSTPVSNSAMTCRSDEGTSNRESAMVSHSLEIPKCISPEGGSLADFAAQLTCLFWFESIKVHQAAEKVDMISPTQRIPRLNKNAIPQPNFKKWVHSILSATQVTQNVIMLALLFIYRLKMTNPGVKGRPGSEYRLLTVALMLGNKFLDDNTYTNKTWADVSLISVKEIHMMEVEFLSNMRYSLLASKEEWEAWIKKLANFWQYCERAMLPPASPLVIPHPSRGTFVSPLPSPTGTQLTPMQQALSPAAAFSPGGSNMYAANGGQAWPTTYQDPATISPLATKPDLKNVLGKRRLADDDPTEPPPKRMSIHQAQPLLVSHLPSQVMMDHQAAAQSAPPASVPEPMRLPAPQLTLNTAPHTQQQPTTTGIPYAATASFVPQTQSALSLPPLVPGVRAMSTVYPTPAVAAAGVTLVSQVPILATSSGPGLPTPATTVSHAGTPTPNPYVPTGYGTPTKRMSPNSSLTPAGPAYASSPMAENFAHMSGVHTPVTHSPSIYLQQRSSPYKPVRSVNTLLYPPPSASLQEYHLAGSVLNPSQMHYQPLGRRNEFRTGIVPEFQGMPYGGAVERGLALTPVHGSYMPTTMTTRAPGHPSLQAPYLN